MHIVGQRVWRNGTQPTSPGRSGRSQFIHRKNNKRGEVKTETTTRPGHFSAPCDVISPRPYADDIKLRPLQYANRLWKTSTTTTTTAKDYRKNHVGLSHCGVAVRGTRENPSGRISHQAQIGLVSKRSRQKTHLVKRVVVTFTHSELVLHNTTAARLQPSHVSKAVMLSYQLADIL